jgi:cell division transport system permease protein
MRKLLFLIRKFLIHIYSRPLPAITSLLSMLLLFLMFDLVWISSLSVDKYYDQILGDIDMEIFFEDSLPDSSLTIVTDAIKELDGIESFEYISKEDARTKLHALMGTDLLEGLGENPLPKSIVITFNKNYVASQYLNTAEESLRKFKGISEIYYPKFWLEKAEFTRLLVSRSVIFIGAVIFLAVILNLLYSVRLSVKTYAEELFQYRLLGAGRIFLAMPYILEGIFYALTASICGWLIVYNITGSLTFRNFEVLLPSQPDIVLYCLAVFVVGMVGGYIGVRRSL